MGSRHASLTLCRYGLKEEKAIPSALITVAIPARTSNPGNSTKIRKLELLRRSAGDSQAHSPTALVSGFHLTPTL